MQENRNKQFASLTFTVFDEDKSKNKIYRTGDASVKCDGTDSAYWFYTSMVVRIPIEDGVRFHGEKELIGTGKVYDRGFMEEQYRVGWLQRNV